MGLSYHQVESRRERMRADQTLVGFVNAVCMEVAEMFGVLVTDLVGAARCRTQRVAAARRDLAERLRTRISSRRVGSSVEYCVHAPGLEIPGWAPISLPDLAILLGASNHTSVLVMLRQRHREVARAAGREKQTTGDLTCTATATAPANNGVIDAA